MKTTILTFALLVSSFVFTQETYSNIDFDQAHELFNVNLPKDKKFVYLDPSTYTVYNNTVYGGDVAYIDSNARKVLGLDAKGCLQFHKDLKSNNDQVIFGDKWIGFDSKDEKLVLDIMNNSKSTKEAFDKLKSLPNGTEILSSTVSNYNKEHGGNYYTISGFYYTIRKDVMEDGKFRLSIIYPIDKEVAFKQF